MHKEKPMDPGPVLDLKAFVPSKDLELSKRFYSDIGFTLNWANDEVAQFEVGAFRFIVQRFYVKEHAENFMMHLMVEDAGLWWAHFECIKLKEKYPDIMLKPPMMQPWGLRVLYISDPTGTLWHIADKNA